MYAYFFAFGVQMKLKVLITLMMIFLMSETTFSENTTIIFKPDDGDGMLASDEYRIIDPDGATTRRPCPYTCKMRGIPKNQCKEWRSASNPDDCYVQDTSLGGDAMPKNEKN